jgi:hypothetical protein
MPSGNKFTANLWFEARKSLIPIMLKPAMAVTN